MSLFFQNLHIKPKTILVQLPEMILVLLRHLGQVANPTTLPGHWGQMGTQVELRDPRLVSIRVETAQNIIEVGQGGLPELFLIITDGVVVGEISVYTDVSLAGGVEILVEVGAGTPLALLLVTFLEVYARRAREPFSPFLVVEMLGALLAGAQEHGGTLFLGDYVEVFLLDTVFALAVRTAHFGKILVFLYRFVMWYSNKGYILVDC